MSDAQAHCYNCFYYYPYNKEEPSEGVCQVASLKHGMDFGLNAFAHELCKEWVHKNFPLTSGAAQRVQSRFELMEL